MDSRLLVLPSSSYTWTFFPVFWSSISPILALDFPPPLSSFFPLSLSFLFLFSRSLRSPLCGTTPSTPFSHLVISRLLLCFFYSTMPPRASFIMRYAAGGGGGVLGIKKHKTIAIAESANAHPCHMPPTPPVCAIHCASTNWGRGPNIYFSFENREEAKS